MTQIPKLRIGALVALLVLVVAAAGCGGSSKNESAADQSAAKAEQEAKNQQPIPEPKAPTSAKVAPTSGEADLAKKPTVPKGTGSAPTALKAETLIAGNGAEIRTIGDLHRAVRKAGATLVLDVVRGVDERAVEVALKS